MDIYKVKSIVKNGQLIIDLPDEFENTDVEVSVSLVSSSKEYTSSSEPISVAEEHSTAYAKHNLPNKKTDESGIIPPREKVDLRKLRGAIKSDLSINEIDAIARSMRGDSPFVPPRKRI